MNQMKDINHVKSDISTITKKQEEIIVATEKKCKVLGCNSLGILNKNGKYYLSKGMCSKHSHRYRKFGDALISGNRIIGNNVSKNPSYSSYRNMKNRCFNKSDYNYRYYGGRGITVCSEWIGINGFLNFIRDIGERPLGMTLDRIDNNGNYSKKNCRWATKHEQSSNKRNNTQIVGVSYCKRDNLWIARFQSDGKLLKFSFKEKQDAINKNEEIRK